MIGGAPASPTGGSDNLGASQRSAPMIGGSTLAAMAAEDRPIRANQYAAAGQYLKEIADLIRAGAQVVDDDNGVNLAEQPGAPMGSD